MKKIARSVVVALALSLPAASLRAQAIDSVVVVNKGGQSLFRVNADGKVGIGTSTPAQKLTVNGTLRAADTISTGTGVRFPDGTLQTTAATGSAASSSSNTPNTLVLRDANGAFAAGKAVLDSTYVIGRSQFGFGDVIVERLSALANDNDSILTVRNGTTYGFRVNRDGGVLARGFFNGSPSGSGVPAEGSGLRMMWYPGKAAFRAGSINGTQWDDANIGTWSTAFGQDVRALGDYSLAVGARAVAANVGTFALGEDVTATGANSIVMGYKASTSTGAGSPRLGTFVFGDRSTSATGDTVHATTTNAAFWRVANGMYIWTASNLSSGIAIQSGSSTTSPWCSITNAMISASNCAYLSSGGTWTNSSDVNRKHSFEYVSGEDVLAKLRRMPITSWTYNTDPEGVKHIGPTAQDFHRAFNLNGADQTHIATIDADGVALAAAKALDDRTAKLQAKVDAQQKEIEELKSTLNKLQLAIQKQ